MMELTKSQIQQIENYLTDINFDYQDLKPEIIDHMASEIEDSMQNDLIDFDTAFVLVRIKWNKSFRKVSGFYFGRFSSAPKIIIKKASKIYRPFYIGLLLSYFIPLLLFKNVLPDVSIANKPIATYLSFVALLSVVVSLFVLIKIRSSKINTIYKFIIKTNMVSAFFLSFLVLLFFFLKAYSNIFIPFYCSAIYISFMFSYFYAKHHKFLSKNRIKKKQTLI